MNIFQGDTIAQVYEHLIVELLNSPQIGNTREIQNCMLQIKKPSSSIVSFPKRAISDDYANAELAWYWSGDNRCETIGKHAKMWLSLTDDGVTNNSAYGYIIEKKYGFDQLQQIIKLLKQDPNSRRAVLNISDPAIDRINTKDMQCTIAIQFLIRYGKVNETVYMRSNDVYFGLPYDYIYFVSIQEYIARKLDLDVGTYTHVATSIHMYDRDYVKFMNGGPDRSHWFKTREIVETNYENKSSN